MDINQCFPLLGGLGCISCSEDVFAQECASVAIGGECGGGKVAYHDGEGGALIAHSTDNNGGSTIQWGCNGQSVGTTSAELGTGLANTNAIVAFHNNTANFGGNDYYTFGGDYSTIGCNVGNDGTVAAKICSDLSSGGYNDWYLPSKDELGWLFASKGAVGGYASEWYWSSSESSLSSARAQHFASGYQLATASKNNIHRVRCVRSFSPWACGDNITDSRDSTVYTTVPIGTQCWMQENLNYDDGCSSVTWVNESDEGWCGCYSNVSANCDTDGRLYQRSVAMQWDGTGDPPAEGSQGICPDGWHVPVSAEFYEIQNYIIANTVETSDTVIRGLKSCRQNLGDFCAECYSSEICPSSDYPRWDYDDTHYGHNYSGFTALATGHRKHYGSFALRGHSALFFLNEQLTSNSVSVYGLRYYESNSPGGLSYYGVGQAFPVRCVMD